MQVLDNPYFHWGPIRDQRYFYDREQETRRIVEAVNHGQCVSLVGPHKIGKTSLLFHLKALNQGVSSNEGTDHVYVYIDGGAHRKSRPSALYSEALHGIDDVLAAQDGSVQPMEEPKDGMDLADLWRAFSSLIRRGIGPVILIDEFDVFCENQSFGLDFFSGLRSLATRGVVYVTATKRTLFQLNREKEILGSPFFNYFKTLHVGLFDDESTLKLIREPSAECGVQFDEQMVTEIVRLAGRHPFLSQQVCHIAFDMRRGQKGASSEQDLEQVRIRSRQELDEQMASWWHGLELEEQQALFGVATGTGSSQVSEVTLENLARQCLLVRANGDYRIFSTLFWDYVRNQTRPTLPREQKWLDRFQDWEELGRGAMSIVYKAYQPALDRHVAIKELITQADLLDEDIERFRREARLIAHLDHPNILPVYDFYPEVDRAYTVMKYAAAGSLADRLNKDKLPFDPAKAVQIMIYTGRALGYAHRQGVIHRHIKPTNIFMGEDDWPLLGDFGLALTRGEAPAGETGMTGSSDYVSPEQAVDYRDADYRSDIYSLGVILYHLLVGEIPYVEEAHPGGRLIRRLTQHVPSPRLRNPQISLEMERIVLKATAPNRDDRYQTAEDMVQDLESTLLGPDGFYVRFFEAAGFEVERETRNLFWVKSAIPEWQDAGEIPVYCFAEGQPVTGNDIMRLARETMGEIKQGAYAFIGLHERLVDGAARQLWELRQEDGLIIIPIHVAEIKQTPLRPRGTLGPACRKLVALKRQWSTLVDPYASLSALSDPQWFFGRRQRAMVQEILSEIVGGIDQFVVYGMRRVGKTTLLNQLVLACQERRYPVAQIMCRPFSAQYTYADVLSEIIQGLGSGLEALYPDFAVPSPRVMTERYSPSTASRFRKDVAELAEAVHRQINQDVRFVLVLDEVDQIFPRQESPELVYDQYCSLAQVLKSVLETPGRGGAISVVAAMEYQWIHLTDRFSNRQFQNPLYGRFRLKPVGLLQRDGWADMVQTLGELAGLEYVPEGLDLLYRKSSGHPDITRRLCSCLVELRDDGKISSPIVAEDVALALGHFLKHPHSYAYYLKNTFWNNPLSVDLDAEQRLVLELAKEQELSEESLLSRLLEHYQEYARAQTGAPASNERIIEERSRLTDALCHLVELGIITEDKQKGTYAISIPIYRDWIRQEILAMEVEYQ